jgi:hypothetical protein
MFDDGTGPALYAEGLLLSEPSLQHSRLVRLRHNTWQILDQGIPPLRSGGFFLTLNEGAGLRLYALVETFQPNPPIQTTWWVVWHGSSWEPASSLLFDGVNYPFCSFADSNGAAIYGAGPGGSFGAVKKFVGNEWRSIGNLQSNNNLSMAGLNLGDGPALYVAGNFAGIEGIPNTLGIAKWNGTSWSGLGEGLVGDYMEMCVFNSGHGDELYVSGVQASGSLAMNGIAKWNGQQWLRILPDAGNSVRHIAVFDDGGGPALIAVGALSTVEGLTCHGWAKYDGQHWHPMPGAVASGSYNIAVDASNSQGPSLFVNGGAGIYGVAQFVGCSAATCYANCDNSTAPPILNVNDFVCFMNRFAAQDVYYPFRDPYANCDQDYPATYTIVDFQCFINRFAVGCH